LLVVLMFIMTGCVLPSGPEQPTPSATVTTPVIAVAPPNGLPGALISVASAGWQPKEAVYINLHSIQRGKTIATPVAVATADNDGRVTASFALPPDAAKSDSPNLTVTAYSAVTGVKTSTPFTVGTVTTTAPIPSTATVTQTMTATPT